MVDGVEEQTGKRNGQPQWQEDKITTQSLSMMIACQSNPIKSTSQLS